MYKSDAVIHIIATNNCADDEDIRGLVCNPDRFIEKCGAFWMHKDNSRGSLSRMVDEWIEGVIREYENSGRDLGSGEVEEIHCWLSCNPAVDDIITAHLANTFVLNVDIRKFFDNITYAMVEQKIPPSLTKAGVIRSIYFCKNGTGLKRGLKGSAPIAELVGRYIIDGAIKKIIYQDYSKDSITYNRYCDDMILSCKNKEVLRDIERRLTVMLRELGFTVNLNKTKLRPLNSSTILGRRIHNGKIIISKRRRNRARLKYYNALKAYSQCNCNDEDSILRALATIESALGTANYIKHYHIVKESTLVELKDAKNSLIELLKSESENSPLAS